MITSASNHQIRNIIQLKKKASVRKRQGLFVVEGLKMVDETPAEAVAAIYVSESFCGDDTRLRRLEKIFPGKVPVIVSDNIYKSMSDTVSPQGIMALVRMREMSLEDVRKTLSSPCKDMPNGNHTVIVLENLRDPGNMGTIIRTAEGAGVSLILMGNECVDIYNPKVVRSTMGSIFRVPMAISDNLIRDINMLKDMEFLTYAAHLEGGNYFEECRLSENVALIIGNEASGVSEELSAAADGLIKIPMSGMVESLNAAVAAAILMYEARRNKHRMYLEKSKG